MDFPTLFHKDKKGNIREWKVWYDERFVYTAYGLLNGATQVSQYAVEPKNLGRTNGTTLLEQAEKEAASKFKYNLDRKYSRTIAEAEVIDTTAPMKAQKIQDHPIKKFPVDVQRKLNGFRCLIFFDLKTKMLVASSKSGIHYTKSVYHILIKLKNKLPPNVILDGELYCHGISLQTIASWAKKYKPGRSECLEFRVFDIIDTNGKDLPWRERRKQLRTFFKQLPATKKVQRVTHTKCDSLDEVYTLQKQFVAEGYEGAIVRILDGMYRFSYRSQDLLKVKTYHDKEFVVIGCKEGKGKFKGKAIWVCKLNENIWFSVTPKCSMMKRAYYWTNKEKFYGKKLTVRYFEESDDGVPLQPVGIDFREVFDDDA